MRTSLSILFAIYILTAVVVNAQTPPSSCPMHNEHQGKREEAQNQGDSHRDHLAVVNRRGERAMGFSQTETTHHFRLTSQGGEIEVSAVDPTDSTSKEKIRRHLTQIARAFTAGDFSIPQAVHSQLPPGVSEMKRLKAKIQYRFRETERGGEVLISTRNAGAVNAIHDFLRFQITDHQTGDPLQVER